MQTAICPSFPLGQFMASFILSQEKCTWKKRKTEYRGKIWHELEEDHKCWKRGQEIRPSNHEPEDEVQQDKGMKNN